MRFGVREHERRVCAEIDLTGVPAVAAPRMFPIALAGLTASAEWALPGLAAAVDTGLDSVLLASAPPV